MQAAKACDYSGVSSFAVAVVEYTLAVILHILRVDRDDDKVTGYTADFLATTRVSDGPWVARRRWNTMFWLYFPCSGLTATTKGLDALLVLLSSPVYHGMQADKT
jgi:hypothetical protein